MSKIMLIVTWQGMWI